MSGSRLTAKLSRSISKAQAEIGYAIMWICPTFTTEKRTQTPPKTMRMRMRVFDLTMKTPPGTVKRTMGTSSMTIKPFGLTKEACMMNEIAPVK